MGCECKVSVVGGWRQQPHLSRVRPGSRFFGGVQLSGGCAMTFCISIGCRGRFRPAAIRVSSARCRQRSPKPVVSPVFIHTVGDEWRDLHKSREVAGHEVAGLSTICVTFLHGTENCEGH